jgi:hypothetical protein
MRAFRLLLPVFALLVASSTSFAQTLPPNPQPTCVASSTLFNSWFVSGSPSLNGAVNPANSITFQPNTNCDFYLWSHQMLLWMLSPAPSNYGGAGRVFDSNVFYDVTTPISNKRYFVPHRTFPLNATAQDKAMTMVGVRPAKPGPNGLPAVIDRHGNIIEVLSAATSTNNRPLLRNQAGKLVEVGRVTVGANRKAIFHDANGKVIAQPKLNIPANLKGARVGVQFLTDTNETIIVGPDGIVFDVSPAQAQGAGVLLAQNSSVVYYTILANDVYAYYASQINSQNPVPAALFPTTQANLNAIEQYAGQTFPDGIALAVEVKLSWVDISAVQNPANYITSPAFVPVYDTSNPQKWAPTGQQKFTTLALVGVHFVGSVTNHPEMVWSTFEHFGNTPVGQYQYNNNSNPSQTITVPASSAGTWLFSTSNSNGPFNVVHANYKTPPYIMGSPIPGQSGQFFNVSPSDTQLVYAFGVSPNTVPPNQEDATPAGANTEVLSSDISVLSQIPSGDVRANYYFIGSTWTFGGYAPTGQYSSTNNSNGAEIGTNRLANSTMETYHQATTSINPPQGSGSNCFSCHDNSTTGQKATTEVSHIFSDMQPLGTVPAVSPTDVAPPHVIPTLMLKRVPAKKK